MWEGLCRLGVFLLKKTFSSLPSSRRGGCSLLRSFLRCPLAGQALFLSCLKPAGLLHSLLPKKFFVSSLPARQEGCKKFLKKNKHPAGSPVPLGTRIGLELPNSAACDPKLYLFRALAEILFKSKDCF
ncbi:hypothetical protein [uncultured Rikenella sp.]|uniref:hypothetical protein n=1 Tax=uncultured Rikenella sp. TaxID=368003 RepID=UPI002620F672|nr:hypothetical protein [uncultured Rikenella sp.]